MKRLLFVGLVAAMVSGCVPQGPTEPSEIVITNTNTNTQGGNGPGASPTPTSGGGELPPGSIIRIGLFGQSPNPGPPNGSRQILVGNTGFITATPKDPNGNDIPASVHGPNIAWSVLHGGGNIQVNVPSEPFNRDVKCLTPGVFGLSAQVKNVTGSADFECVQRAGSSALDVIPRPTTCSTCQVTGSSSLGNHAMRGFYRAASQAGSRSGQ